VNLNKHFQTESSSAYLFSKYCDIYSLQEQLQIYSIITHYSVLNYIGPTTFLLLAGL
jgi:hypothetical protein